MLLHMSVNLRCCVVQQVRPFDPRVMPVQRSLWAVWDWSRRRPEESSTETQAHANSSSQGLPRPRVCGLAVFNHHRAVDEDVLHSRWECLQIEHDEIGGSTFL